MAVKPVGGFGGEADPPEAVKASPVANVFWFCTAFNQVGVGAVGPVSVNMAIEAFCAKNVFAGPGPCAPCEVVGTVGRG